MSVLTLKSFKYHPNSNFQFNSSLQTQISLFDRFSSLNTLHTLITHSTLSSPGFTLHTRLFVLSVRYSTLDSLLYSFSTLSHSLHCKVITFARYYSSVHTQPLFKLELARFVLLNDLTHTTVSCTQSLTLSTYHTKNIVTIIIVLDNPGYLLPLLKVQSRSIWSRNSPLTSRPLESYTKSVLTDLISDEFYWITRSRTRPLKILFDKGLMILFD